jgi:hypothetical protein
MHNIAHGDDQSLRTVIFLSCSVIAWSMAWQHCSGGGTARLALIILGGAHGVTAVRCTICTSGEYDCPIRYL